MTKKLFIIQLMILALLTTGCTTYRSKSGIKFDDADVYGQQPRVFVGKLEETPDQLSFVAKIEAVVKRPTIFHEAATREQVNIVLAEKAANLGADAVTYVDYEEKFGHIWATAQAVKINSLYQSRDQVIQDTSSNNLPNPATPDTTTPVIPQPQVQQPEPAQEIVSPTQSQQSTQNIEKRPLTRSSNRNLAMILGTLDELANYQPFSHSNLRVRVFTSQNSAAQCLNTLESCPNIRLFIAVDPGDQYDLPRLYELPPAKGWRLDRKLKTVSDTVGLVLSTSLPDNSTIEKSAKNSFRHKTYTVWLGLTPSYEVR